MPHLPPRVPGLPVHCAAGQHDEQLVQRHPHVSIKQTQTQTKPTFLMGEIVA